MAGDLPPLGRGATPYGVNLDLDRAGFEAAIAGEEIEVDVAFDGEGRFVLRPRTGSSQEVSFSPEEFVALQDSVVTHNHPAGGVFSQSDVGFACHHDVMELRIVTPEGLVYALGRSSQGWPEAAMMQAVVHRSIASVLFENRRRGAEREPIMKGRKLDDWMYAFQRDALAQIGVEMRRTDRWS